MVQQSDASSSLATAKRQIENNAIIAAENSQTKIFNLASITIVATFCLYIGGTAVFIGYCAINKLEWLEVYKALLDLLKTAVLPVTSTVLGYYIAQTKSKR